MLFHSRQIKGEGRGHSVGFPTINLAIPHNLVLDDGIYAVWAVVRNVAYKGEFHNGSIPTFNIKEKTLEFHLINMTDDTVPDTEDIEMEIDVVERLRGVMKFDDAEELAIQISRDIADVNNILK